MTLTTDPNDPRLTHGVDSDEAPQAEVYLVLSEEEIEKGLVRSVRLSYVHVGNMGPKFPTRDLTEEEKERHAQSQYVLYEAYPDPESSVVGRYWTQAQLDAATGCGSVTTMAYGIAETYARSPRFYGSTYCVRCRKHLPVEEFVWEGTDERVGS